MRVSRFVSIPLPSWLHPKAVSLVEARKIMKKVFPQTRFTERSLQKGPSSVPPESRFVQNRHTQVHLLVQVGETVNRAIVQGNKVFQGTTHLAEQG